MNFDIKSRSRRVLPAWAWVVGVFLATFLAGEGEARAQVNGWGDGGGPAATTSPTREAAIGTLGANIRVAGVLYFDADDDEVDDELLMLSSDPDHCENVPNHTPDCGPRAAFLKRSTGGWTVYAIDGQEVHTTYSWIGGFHSDQGNVMVVESRGSSEDPDDGGPPLTHGYVLIAWRDGALHLLHDEVRFPDGERLYLSGVEGGFRFSNSRGCELNALFRGNTIVTDRAPRCPPSPRRHRRHR
jgi:hypothetical protein